MAGYGNTPVQPQGTAQLDEMLQRKDLAPATREWLVRNSGVSMEDLAAKRGDGAPEDDAFSELLARKDLSEDSKVWIASQRGLRGGRQAGKPSGAAALKGMCIYVCEPESGRKIEIALWADATVGELRERLRRVCARGRFRSGHEGSGVTMATEDDAWTGKKLLHGTKVLGADSEPLSDFEVVDGSVLFPMNSFPTVSIVDPDLAVAALGQIKAKMLSFPDLVGMFRHDFRGNFGVPGTGVSPGLTGAEKQTGSNFC